VQTPPKPPPSFPVNLVGGYVLGGSYLCFYYFLSNPPHPPPTPPLLVLGFVSPPPPELFLNSPSQVCSGVGAAKGTAILFFFVLWGSACWGVACWGGLVLVFFTTRGDKKPFLCFLFLLFSRTGGGVGFPTVFFFFVFNLRIFWPWLFSILSVVF